MIVIWRILKNNGQQNFPWQVCSTLNWTDYIALCVVDLKTLGWVLAALVPLFWEMTPLQGTRSNKNQTQNRVLSKYIYQEICLAVHSHTHTNYTIDRATYSLPSAEPCVSCRDVQHRCHGTEEGNFWFRWQMALFPYDREVFWVDTSWSLGKFRAEGLVGQCSLFSCSCFHTAPLTPKCSCPNTASHFRINTFNTHVCHCGLGNWVF